MLAVKKLDISDLKALLLSEELKAYEREIVYNERYVREAENNKEKYRQACIKRGIPELFESKPPPITLLNHKYCPEPKLFGEKYPIIPIESRLPILAYGLIPHFCLALFIFFIALIDL
jgi:hypothetical protein